MASRMERYYKPSKQVTKRTQMNQDLYHKIYETSEYSNIEGIATIEKSNEIDIMKVKNMLKNREAYKKQKDLRSILYKEPEEIESISYEEPEENRNYDISDVLNKAKTEKKPDDKYRSLGNTNYDILKSLRVKGSAYKEEQEHENNLEQTLVNTRVLNSLKDSDLSLDLLGDLKSNNTTMVGAKDTIHQLLEEAKEEEKKKKEKEKKAELDTSFFTSSLSFGQDDFEEMTSASPKRKKKVWVKRTILGIILTLVTVGIIVLVYMLIK